MSDIVIVVILFLIIGGWLFVILDEAIWQLFGKEQCVYTDKGIIVKEFRLKKRQWTIAWDEITSITTYNPTAVRKAITYITAAGLPQETILIIYRNGKKHKCGVNLNKYQTLDAIEKLNNLKRYYERDSSP